MNLDHRAGADHNEALDLLVAKAGGHARDLLKSLELVASAGPVERGQVELLFKLGGTQPMVDYLKSVLRRENLSNQIRILSSWQTEAGLKADALQRLLMFLFMTGVKRQHYPDRTLTRLAPMDCRWIVAVVEERALSQGRDLRLFWQTIIGFWTLDLRAMHEGALRERIIAFDDLVNPPQQKQVELSSRGRTLPLKSSRPARRSPERSRQDTIPSSVVGATRSHLTKTQARSIWEAGSLMARVHGCWFNTRAFFVHDRLHQPDHRAGAALVGAFVHELRLALRRWHPGAERAFHWLYLHEFEPGRGHVTQLVAHLPPALRRDVRAWVFGSFLRGKCGLIPTGALRLRHSSTDEGLTESRVIAWHAHQLRMLCRGLDPDVMVRDQAGARRPLLDVLRVRPCLRRSLGPLTIKQRLRFSSSIGEGARELERRQGFEGLSAFDANAWEHLDDGWEIEEHADRARWRRETMRRDAARCEPHGLMLFSSPDASRVEADAEESFVFEPREMLRSWHKW